MRVDSKGGISFVIKYRVKGSPEQKFVTLGRFPALLPDKAREEARAIKAAASMRNDLLAEREAERAAARAAAEEARRRAVPLPNLLAAWRAAMEASVTQRAAEGRSTRHEREMLLYEARVMRAAFAGDTVGAFDPGKFQALLSRQPSVYQALNLRKAISRFAKFANAEMTLRGLPLSWPTKFDVDGETTSRSDRYSIEECARIWIAGGRLGRRGQLVRLVLLSGCRLVEGRKLEIEHLRLDDPTIGAHWEQPVLAGKSKRFHRVPLVAPLVSMLSWLPPRKVMRGKISPYVFSGRGGVPLSGLTPIREAMRREAGLKKGAFHDMRRTIVSILGDHGFDPHVADTLLNHSAAATLPGVMGVYQRSEFWTQKVKALNYFTELVMAEVERIQGAPLNRETWGFEAPFDDVEIPTTRKRTPRIRKKAA